jgi:periplasmic copper chaperone A
MMLTGWMRTLAAGIAALLAMEAGAVDVAEAWSRATPPGATTAVVYLVLRNPAAAERRLMRVATPAATSVSLHESSIDAQGMSRMWPVASLRLAAGQTMTFSPGGRHFMLEGLKAPLQAGTRFALELQFDGGEPPVRLQVDVRPLVPEATKAPAHHHAH